MKIYCFDLDGTLCTNTEGSYESAEPYFARIAKVNELFEAGEKILIFTARGTVTGINWRELTESQLKLWGVKYHELQLGKPFAHVYIDDRGISDESFFTNL
jgi:hypothetical protein